MDATLAVINVTQGKRYRFRLVSVSCDPNFTFYIQGHNMTVIEADSVSVQPVTVDSIQIFAGQRYSFVVRLLFLILTTDVSATATTHLRCFGYSFSLPMEYLHFADN